ncbi:hypothetical protein WDL1P1_00562 (plasmid) [Variovorax sp. WDL1]|nr:hypothetical protein CHC06_06128 [Variovorax sp. B2]PNG51377.1 hypothetical protein CHC07_06034 [Variovorax sp. B4]VTV17653.1 hypothetical protein WDL1P1_00562 [Variovorax sp. WDL1]
MSLETWSDVCGLVSGILLVVTAWRNDGLYGFVDNLRKVVSDAKAKSRPEDPMAPVVIAALEAELSRWSWVDRWSLRGGAVFLVAAFLLKLLAPAK